MRAYPSLASHASVAQFSAREVSQVDGTRDGKYSYAIALPFLLYPLSPSLRLPSPAATLVFTLVPLPALPVTFIPALSKGAVALELIVLWLYLVLRLMANLSHPLMFIKNLFFGVLQRIESRAMYHLPLEDVDKLLTGECTTLFLATTAAAAAAGPAAGSRQPVYQTTATRVVRMEITRTPPN